jgi:hypothetical protein
LVTEGTTGGIGVLTGNNAVSVTGGTDGMAGDGLDRLIGGIEVGEAREGGGVLVLGCMR